jgi:hypothetical protein
MTTIGFNSAFFLGNFIQNLPWCFLPNFGSFGYSFSEEDYLEIDQSETRITYGGHV